MKKDNTLKEARLRELARGGLSVNRANEVLKKEFGSGIRKTVALDIMAQELQRQRRPAEERKGKYTPTKLTDAKQHYVVIWLEHKFRQKNDDLRADFEQRFNQIKKYTKIEIDEIYEKNKPEPDQIQDEIKNVGTGNMVNAFTELVEGIKNAVSTLYLSENDSKFIAGDYYRIDDIKNISAFLTTVQDQYGTYATVNLLNQFQNIAAIANNNKFTKFVEGKLYQ